MRYILLLIIFFLSLHSQALPSSCNNHQTTFTVGLLPWTSNKLKHYVSNHFSKVFDKECVSFIYKSDKDYSTYLNSILLGKYDIFSIPSHMGSFLILEHGFIPLAFSEADSASTVIIVRQDSNIKNIQDLNNINLVTPDPLAIVTMVTIDALKNADVNIRYTHLTTHNEVLEAVKDKRFKAGTIYSKLLEKYSANYADEFRIIKEYPLGFGGLILAKEDLDEHVKEVISNKMVDTNSYCHPIAGKLIMFNKQEQKEFHKYHQPYIKKLRLLLP